MDCGAVGNMGEVEKCWRAQVKKYLVVEAVWWIGCEFGVRKVATGERKGGGGGEKKRIYISDISESKARS